MKLVPQNNNNPAFNFINDLNEAQRDAVITTEGPVLIIAGAGSGKTKALTYRIAYLLAKGVPAYSILALTFTNKAAGEMKERIATMVGEETARKVWAGTFHSLFARILRMEADSIGFTSSFSIYDTDDSLSIIREIMNKNGISSQQFIPQGIRSRISNAKNQMIGWQEYDAQANDIHEKQTALVYKEYEKKLRLNNAMDFDDILLNMIRLLRDIPEARAKYQKRFSYIMVDEYQDTNRAQYIAVSLLSAAHKNICVVGDDAQSIYRWRGADIRNILEFQKDYPEAKTVRLEQNYRSTQTILAAADAVIAKNKKQLKKTLWTENSEGDLISVISNRDDREEANSILQSIRKDIAEHSYSEKEFAVLYRTNAQSLALEDALRRGGIAYTIIGGTPFYKRKEVKDTLAYLRLLCNPQDSESLARIINEPARGIGPTTMRKLNDYADTFNVTLFTAFEHAAQITGLQKRAVQSAFDFTSMITTFREKRSTSSAPTLASDFIEATGLLRALKEDNTDESLDRWNNIQRLLSHIQEMFDQDEAMSLEDYLQHIALISDVDEAQFGANRITLMTMHAAKGLEFPVVFIAGLEQGLFPMGKAEHDLEEEEEERRLFYVGITRARIKLYLTFAERRYRFGELVFSQPSKFLQEIPNHLLAWEQQDSFGSSTPGIQGRFTGSFRRSQQPIPKEKPKEHFFDDIQSSGDESYSQIESGAPQLRPGLKVYHAQFGSGTIQSLAGEGDKKQATVMFQSVGRKQLLLKFAKLQIE